MAPNWFCLAIFRINFLALCPEFVRANPNPNITVNYSYTGLSVTGPPENFSPGAETAPQYVYVAYSLVFGYTGFLIYRTLNLSLSQSGIRVQLTVVFWSNNL